MQASNKSDAMQVYEGATRSTKTGMKGSLKYSFKFILKPLTLFGYHYFVEGIKAVQKDGPTKELDKLTNLSYDETIKVMEKCQKDGIRVVASERTLLKENDEFGKRKSLYQQKKLTKYSRRIKQLSDFKAKHPKIAKLVYLNMVLKKNEKKQEEQLKQHKSNRYNIYFNKSKAGYMASRIEDLIEYRTGISKDLFDKDTQVAIDEIRKNGMNLNSQELRNMAEKFKLHEVGDVEIEDFKSDYCIHELPLSSYMTISNDLEVADIPYGVKTITNDAEEKIANIYFENKHLERYSELGFNSFGQIHVYGKDTNNFQWNVKSKDEIISFKTKTGEQEKQTYSILSGKDYIMKRQENECLWTVLKSDLKELAEKEKKRDVVSEDLEKLHIFEELEKSVDNSPTIKEDVKEIEVNFDNDFEKEAGD